MSTGALANLSGLLGGGQSSASLTSAGSGLLGSLLGDKAGALAGTLASVAGLRNSQSASSLLALLAPIVLGFITLFHKTPAPYHLSIPLIATFTVALGGLWVVAITKAVAARRSPVTVGPQELVGLEGVVRQDSLVFVHGELWHATAAAPLREGELVAVDSIDGLTLRVHPVGPE